MLGIIRLWLVCGLCTALQIQFNTTSSADCSGEFVEGKWCGNPKNTQGSNPDADTAEKCKAHCEGTGFVRPVDCCSFQPSQAGYTTTCIASNMLSDQGWTPTLMDLAIAGTRYAVLCTAKTLPPTPSPPTPAPTTTSPTTAPTQVPSPCDTGAATCRVIEDPHISAFDGGQISLVESKHVDTSSMGDKWLVKGASVSIQARYEADEKLAENNLFVRMVAIGGRFLGGSVITVGSLEDHITWNSKPILEHDFGGSNSSSFELNDEGMVVKITHTEHSVNVANPSEESPGIELELPTGVSLIVNRLHHHINLAITMSPQEAGQEGLCGNFNGVALDDSWELSSQRSDPSVSPEESLFTGVAFT